MTEEYSCGYQEGYQEGWNAAVDEYAKDKALAQPAALEGMKFVKMSPHELAEKLYWEHPTYLGTKPLQWRDAPNEVCREWLDKATAMLAAEPKGDTL